MKIRGASEKAHRREQTDQAKVVITVKMRNEDMIDLAAADLVLGHLHLSAFPTVDKEEVIFHGDDLCGRVAIESR